MDKFMQFNNMKKIEMVLRSLYKNRRYGELSSLYKLFDYKLETAIASELSNHLKLHNTSRFFERIYVDFQWIDKIPLVSFVEQQKDINGNIIDAKTEVGDLFIQYRHTNAFGNDGNTGTHQYCHRSLVVQAKLAENEYPIVPIGRINKSKVNSTSKELKLLQDWPDFDLYETSRNLEPIARGVSVLLSEVPFAFYGGFANASKSWSFGIAKNGEVCDKSFSDIILKLAKNEAGKELSSDEGWEIVSSTITRICHNRKLPPSIAKKIESRHKTSIVKGGITYSFPAQIFDFITTGFDRLFALIVGKKMLVLTIDRVSYEGSDMVRYR